MRSFVLLPHPDSGRVLLVPGPEGWQLPEVTGPDPLDILDPIRANPILRRQFSPDSTSLQAHFAHDESLGAPVNVFMLESHGAAWQPPEGARWVGARELRDLKLVLPSHEAAMTAWFGTQNGSGPPAFPIPWWQPGWFDTSAAWIHRELERLGTPPVGPVEQVKCWALSAVLRVSTQGSHVYFKAVAPPLANEVPVTRHVADRYPRNTPVVLAVDPDRGWLLMADFRGPMFRDQAGDEESWPSLLRSYLGMQHASVGETEPYLSMGCPELSPARMAAQVDTLISGSAERLAGVRQRLTEEETDRLSARAPELKALCAELASFGLPSTLEHGDLHVYNIALTDGRPLFFDWSHACVTHPFFCLPDFFADDDWFPTDPGANARLRDLYLSEWRDYGSPDRLLAAFQIVKRLRWLFRALQSERVIAAYQSMLGGRAYSMHTATGWTMAQLQYWLADFLRKLIAGASVPRP